MQACSQPCIDMIFMHGFNLSSFSVFDLVNIHLFHDASNIVAMQSVSVVLYWIVDDV